MSWSSKDIIATKPEADISQVAESLRVVIDAYEPVFVAIDATFGNHIAMCSDESPEANARDFAKMQASRGANFALATTFFAALSRALEIANERFDDAATVAAYEEEPHRWAMTRKKFYWDIRGHLTDDWGDVIAAPEGGSAEYIQRVAAYLVVK